MLLGSYLGSIFGVKLSVSLPGEDVAFLDEYVKDRGLDSRSAALQRAVRLLRTSELTAPYEAAWDEWHVSGEGETWEPATGDGVTR
jgi:Arc/MetJ-type ribon-helix-helix transcriptional regulator